MNEDNNKLAPGIYLLTCIEGTAYDCCLFQWEKGHQYRLQIRDDGSSIVEAKGLLFAPTQERLEEMLECFKVEIDLDNKVDVYKYFFQKRAEEMNESNDDK